MNFSVPMSILHSVQGLFMNDFDKHLCIVLYMLRYCYDDTFGKQFINGKNKTNDSSSKIEIFVILDSS
jgi:hypothetical protein